MADDIEITAVAISGPRPSPPTLSGAVLPAWYTIVISVRNNSDKTQHVIAEMRNVAYDAASRTLNIQLNNAEPSPEMAQIKMVPHTPVQVAIPAGAAGQIEVQVAAVLKRMIPSAGLGLAFEQIDISGLEKVNVSIDYDTAPLSPIETGGAEARRRKPWGKRAAKIEVVRPSGGPANFGPDHQPEK
jgi:hypothetical protein